MVLKDTGDGTVKKLVKDFVGTTSAHGIPHIIQSKSVWRTMAWLGICLTSATLLGLGLYNLGSKYFTNPKLTRTELKNQAIPFPVVSVCNPRALYLFHLQKALINIQSGYNGSPHYMSRATEIVAKWQSSNHSDAILDQWSLEGLLLAWNLGRNAIREYMQSMRKSDWKTYRFLMHYSLTSESLLSMFGFKKLEAFAQENGKFIASCYFQYDDCNYENFKRFVSSTYYNCYSFDISSIASERETWLTGPRGGMSLQLFAPNTNILGQLPDEDLKALSATYMPILSGDGVRVVVHGEDEWPDPVTNGFDVPSGFAVSAALRVSMFSRFNTANEPCVSVTGNGKRAYSQNRCRKECLQTMIKERCDCVSAILPIKKHEVTPRCGTIVQLPARCYNETRNLSADPGCRAPMDEYIQQALCMKKTISNSEVRHDMMDKCECPPRCDEYVYDAQYSLLKWPTSMESLAFFLNLRSVKFYEQFSPEEQSLFFKRLINGSSTERREFISEGHFVRVNVYIQDNTVVKIVEKASYDVMQVISDIGGQMGLWMGVSIITVAELIHLFMTICAAAVSRKKLQPMDANHDVIAPVQVHKIDVKETSP